MTTNTKFQETYCSQCGETFGPGNSGFSHCKDHSQEMVACPACCSVSGSPRFTGKCQFCGGAEVVPENRSADWPAA